MYIHVHPHMYVHMWMYIHVYKCVDVCIYMYIRVWCGCIHMYEVRVNHRGVHFDPHLNYQIMSGNNGHTIALYDL